MNPGGEVVHEHAFFLESARKVCDINVLGILARMLDSLLVSMYFSLCDLRGPKVQYGNQKMQDSSERS